MDELSSLFEEFLRVRYDKEIRKLVREYPEKRSLEVSFTDIEEYNYETADKILDDPDEYLKALEEAAQNIFSAYGGKGELRVRLHSIPEDRRLLVRDIGAEYIGKLIAVEGVVRQITTVLPKIKIAVWECRYCGKRHYEVQDGMKMKKPFMCTCERQSRVFDLVEDASVWVDFQRIQIQEPLEYLRGGEQARYIDVFLEEDLVNKVFPGDRVLITGILRLVGSESSRRSVYGKYIQAIHIEPVQKEFEELEPTEEEVKKIKELAKDPEIYEKIVRSIAPTIKGHEEIKEAIALQLFGGVKKEPPDGTKIRGNIHILLLGDPSVGKSQLLQFATKLAPKSFYVAGKTATGAGLVASAEKDEIGEGGWVIKAGVLVLASGGLAAVDEFEKIDPKERSALLEAMEQQTVSIAKAGIVTSFKAETAVLAAANPKMGRFDPYENPLTQINIEPPLLARFDLMFIVRENVSEDVDREIAKHILKVHRAGQIRKQYERNISAEYTMQEVEDAEKAITPLLDVELLRKYIAYARANVFPVMSEEAAKEIEDFYVSLRRMGKEKGTVSAAPRQLEALIRLSEASARVRLSNVVTKEDARRAIRLFRESIREVLMDKETGVVDYDVLTTGKTKSVREKMKIVLNVIRHYAKEYDLVHVEDVEKEVEESYGIKRHEFRELVERLKNEGEIYEPKHGYLKLTYDSGV